MIDCSTQVCLISDQMLPNLLPAIHTATRAKQVIMVQSSNDVKWKTKADNLARSLSRHGIESETMVLASDSNPRLIEEDFTKISQRWSHAVLNTTGGKKSMVLSAYIAFAKNSHPAFYVETNNQLIWFAPSTEPGLHLDASIDLEDLMTLQGCTIEQRGSPPPANQIAFSQTIFDRPDLAKAITDLEFKKPNYIASSKTNDQLSKQQIELLKLCAEHGLVKKIIEQWQCPNVENVKFITGGWLEVLVWATLRNIADKLQLKDIEYNIKIKSASGTNEFDGACIYKNRLYLIECKCVNKGNDVQDFLVKIKSLSGEIGGLTGQPLLVIWGTEVGEGNRTRAEQNNIRLLNYTSLDKFELAVQAWLSRS